MSEGGARQQPAGEIEAYSSMSPYDQLIRGMEVANNRKYSPEEMAANKRENLRSLGYMTPVVGNVMSAMDVPENFDAWKDAARSGGDTEQNLAAAKTYLSVLGAMALPAIGSASRSAARGAKDSLNVFVPVEGQSTVNMAQKLYDKGPKVRGKPFTSVKNANKDLYDFTGMFFGPEGKLKKEIPDVSARLQGNRVYQPGDEATLGEVLAHSKLYSERPDLANTKIKFTKDRNKHKQPIARLSEDGETFEITAGAGKPWTQQSLVKLLQYKIGDEAGFAAASRDSLDKRLGDIDSAISRVTEGVKKGTIPEDMATAYLTPLMDTRREIDLAMTGDPVLSNILREAGYSMDRMPAKSDVNKLLRDYVYERLAGNKEVNIVKSRTRKAEGYPYAGGMDDLIVLPPEELRDMDLADFLARWRGYGSGRRR